MATTTHEMSERPTKTRSLMLDRRFDNTASQVDGRSDRPAEREGRIKQLRCPFRCDALLSYAFKLSQPAVGRHDRLSESARITFTTIPVVVALRRLRPAVTNVGFSLCDALQERRLHSRLP